MSRYLTPHAYFLFVITTFLLLAGARPAHAVDGCSHPDFKVARSFDIGTNDSLFRMNLATADFNGDGAADVAAPDFEGNTVAVFLNDGAGWFAPIKFSVANKPFAIAVGNFNGDNDPDLVVTHAETNNISILLGGAGGSFGPATNFTVEFDPRSVAVGDFNNDGKIDVVVGHDGGSNVSVLLGDGAGTFATAPGSPIDISGPVVALAVADFNSDAKSDLIVGTFSGFGYFLLLGNGTGGFSAPSPIFNSGGFGVSGADVTGDGKADIILGTLAGIEVFIGDGTGAFSGPTHINPPGVVEAIAVADIDGDNKQDLVVAGALFGVTFFKGDGVGGFIRGRTYIGKDGPQAIVLSDFDGDGKGDIATAGRSGPVGGVGPVSAFSIILNLGTGDFAAAQVVTTTTPGAFTVESATDLALADFNGDGRTDIAVSHLTTIGPANVDILLGDGSGGFTPAAPITYAHGSLLTRIVTADFNKDGKVDVAVAGVISFTFTHVISINLGNGDGTFAPPNNVSGFGFNPHDLAVSDFNNDTNPDIVVVNSFSESFSILLGNGMGGFTFGAAQSVGTRAGRVAVGDFNGDSKQDLAITDLDDGRVVVLQGNGAGVFAVVQSINLPGRPSAVVVDDFNSDGKRDIAVANQVSVTTTFMDEGSISVLLGDGAGGFATPVHHEMSARPEDLLSKDLDGDGKVDLAVVDRTDSVIEVLAGDGAGAFSAVVQFDFAGGPASIAAEDFNADARPDLAVVASSKVVGLLFGKEITSRPCVFADNATVTEGDSGSTNLEVPVRLSAASLQVVKVNYIVRGFQAKAGQDFTPGVGTVTFAPGETNKVATVSVVGELVDENDESFSLHLSGPLNARISDGIAKLNILDNDSPPSISINDVATEEGNTGIKSASFTANLSAPSSFEVRVGFTVVGGTATISDDFDPVEGTLVFNPGVTSRTITVNLRGDNIHELDETFFVNLSDPVNSSIADAQGQGTILNDDPVPAITVFNAASSEQTGVDNTLTLGFSLSNRSSQTITVDFATADDTATSGSDYVNTTGTVTFNPGETQKTTTITIKDDLIDEVQETFFVNLSNPVNATIADGQAQCFISDNDGPAISINDVSVIEGQGGTTNAVFTISLSAPSVQTVGVRALTADGTAGGSSFFPADFQSFNDRLVTIPAGATSATLTVRLNGDVMIEPDESFFVNLFQPFNATIADGQGVGTITNDDVTSVQLNTGSVTINEADGSVTMTVTRVGSLEGVFIANYDTVDGSASDKSDYTASLGSLRFEPNETTKTITVFLTDDALVEDPENFFIILTGAEGGPTNQPSFAIVTINSNDAAPGPNPVDSLEFFVRQHYRDFLNRDPDPAGFDFWRNQIEECGADAQCREIRRINVSAAFFLSIEFQETGYLAYRFYKSAFGDTTSPNVPGTVPIIRLREFLPDAQRMGQGVQVGIGNWEQQLELNKQAYALEFVQRARFLTLYPETLTAEQFVTSLEQNVGGAISASETAQLLAILGSTPGDPLKRAQVMRAVAEDADLRRAEFNRAFVLMQYYGYLRRNPDDPQDIDFAGWRFWLDKLNQFNGNFIQAEMVKAFISSLEYRQRFGQ